MGPELSGASPPGGLDARLAALLRDDATLYPVADGLWSALAPGGRVERYDEIAARYDRLIGNRWYQRIAWGNDPEEDVRFAREAVASDTGPLLDVGCGSLLFTDAAHAEGGRPSLLIDLSLGMLRRGRERLEARAGRMPPHLALVQADAFALPLRPGCANTVLCPGILHLFEDPAALLRSLASMLAPSGRLFLSSLVTDRGFGRGYLRLLARSGEVAGLRTASELERLVSDVTGLRVHCRRRGNMAWLRGERADVVRTASAAAAGR